MSCQTCAQCFYCDAQLSVRHEHDHHPIAFRHGGDEVVPACINCHDLKDRLSLNNWRPEVLGEAMRQAGPLGRLLLAKYSDLLADLEQARAEVPA